MEAIAIELTKQRIKLKSQKDFMCDEDDAFSWVITYAVALQQVKEAAKEISWEE